MNSLILTYEAEKNQLVPKVPATPATAVGKYYKPNREMTRRLVMALARQGITDDDAAEIVRRSEEPKYQEKLKGMVMQLLVNTYGMSPTQAQAFIDKFGYDEYPFEEIAAAMSRLSPGAAIGRGISGYLPTHENRSFLHEAFLRNVMQLAEGFAKAKELYVDTKKMAIQTLKRLAKKDPTYPAKGKYVEWMAKMYSQGQRGLSKYDVIADFHKYTERNQIEQKDIYRYPSIEAVDDAVRQAEAKLTASQIKRGVKDFSQVPKEDIAFENDKVLVVIPTTEEKSCLYGKGANWCTSAYMGSRNYFKSYYIRQGATLYYILPKSDDDVPEERFEKVAVAVYPPSGPGGVSRTDYYDKNDRTFTREEFIKLSKFWGLPVDTSKKDESFMVTEGFSAAKKRHVDSGEMPISVLKRIAKKDPTYPEKGKYVEWLAKMYTKQKSMRGFDILKEFDALLKSPYLEKKDINSYESVEDLTNAVHAVQGRVIQEQEKKKEEIVRKLLLKADGNVGKAMKWAAGEGEVRTAAIAAGEELSDEEIAQRAAAMGRGNLVRAYNITTEYITKIRDKMKEEEEGIFKKDFTIDDEILTQIKPEDLVFETPKVVVVCPVSHAEDSVKQEEELRAKNKLYGRYHEPIPGKPDAPWCTHWTTQTNLLRSYYFKEGNTFYIILPKDVEYVPEQRFTKVNMQVEKDGSCTLWDFYDNRVDHADAMKLMKDWGIPFKGGAEYDKSESVTEAEEIFKPATPDEVETRRKAYPSPWVKITSIEQLKGLAEKGVEVVLSLGSNFRSSKYVSYDPDTDWWHIDSYIDDTETDRLEDTNIELAMQNGRLWYDKDEFDNEHRAEESLKEAEEIFKPATPEELKKRQQDYAKAIGAEVGDWVNIAKAELERELDVETTFSDDPEGSEIKLEAVAGTEGSNGECAWRVFENEDEAERAAIRQVEDELEATPNNFDPDWLSYYIMMTDTDRRVFANDESDHYVGDLPEEELLREADLQDEYDEIQEMIDELDDDDPGYEEKLKNLEKRQEDLVDEAREKVQEDKYEEIYKELDDPVDYFVKGLGYKLSELLQHTFITIDFEDAAEASVSERGIADVLDERDGESVDLPSGAVAFGTN